MDSNINKLIEEQEGFPFFKFLLSQTYEIETDFNVEIPYNPFDSKIEYDYRGKFKSSVNEELYNFKDTSYFLKQTEYVGRPEGELDQKKKVRIIDKYINVFLPNIFYHTLLHTEFVVPDEERKYNSEGLLTNVIMPFNTLRQPLKYMNHTHRDHFIITKESDKLLISDILYCKEYLEDYSDFNDMIHKVVCFMGRGMYSKYKENTLHEIDTLGSFLDITVTDEIPDDYAVFAVKSTDPDALDTPQDALMVLSKRKNKEVEFTEGKMTIPAFDLEFIAKHRVLVLAIKNPIKYLRRSQPSNLNMDEFNDFRYEIDRKIERAVITK